MAEPCPECRDRVSLKDYVDRRFEEMRHAIGETTRVLEHRLTGMNEFRDQLQQERGEYVRQEPWALALAEINRRLQRVEGRDLLVWIAVLGSTVALVFGLAARFVLYPRP